MGVIYPRVFHFKGWLAGISQTWMRNSMPGSYLQKYLHPGPHPMLGQTYSEVRWIFSNKRTTEMNQPWLPLKEEWERTLLALLWCPVMFHMLVMTIRDIEEMGRQGGVSQWCSSLGLATCLSSSSRQQSSYQDPNLKFQMSIRGMPICLLVGRTCQMHTVVEVFLAPISEPALIRILKMTLWMLPYCMLQ